MLARLAEVLELTLRERNRMLIAAGYAPAYRETPLSEPSMSAIREAVDVMLTAHEPFPAVAIDRSWNIVAANRGMRVLMSDSPPALSSPVPNVFRLVLHPDGLLPSLTNADQVRAAMLDQLRRQLEATDDEELRRIYEEVEAYPAPARGMQESEHLPESPIQVPLRIRTPHGDLTLFSTMTTFGTPADVTVAELALEFFYPLDASSDRILRGLADAAPAGDDIVPDPADARTTSRK